MRWAFRLGYQERKFVSLFVLVATLAPVASLMTGAYQLALEHLVHRRIVASASIAPEPGAIIAVTGQVAAESVKLPPLHPPFRNAMLVLARTETWEWNWLSDRGPKWRTGSSEIWVSPSISLAGWRLERSLFLDAGFGWYRPSPCADYAPPEGWEAKCPGEYVYRKNDPNTRFSYEVTPIPAKTYTLIAQVAAVPRTLTGIHNDIWPGLSRHSILRPGALDPEQILDAQASRAKTMMRIGMAGNVLVSWCYMLAVLRSTTRMAWRMIAWPALWRGLVVAAPHAAMFWGFESGTLFAVFIYTVSASFALGLLFWWLARDAADKAKARPQTVIR